MITIEHKSQTVKTTITMHDTCIKNCHMAVRLSRDLISLKIKIQIRNCCNISSIYDKISLKWNNVWTLYSSEKGYNKVLQWKSATAASLYSFCTRLRPRLITVPYIYSLPFTLNLARRELIQKYSDWDYEIYFQDNIVDLCLPCQKIATTLPTQI